MKQLNWYQIFGQSIPDGRTVTPTDDIQIWLHCGNIWDKNYTTLAQVLADTDTLVALMASDNAVDYLVRSTTWISGICSSEIAMKSIGASDYASTTLLSDSTWCDAIHGSTYSSYVENASVPTMTSNTTPSGTASGTTTQEGDYYKAFDKSTGDYWYGQPANPEYVQYDFGYPVSIFNLYMFVRGISSAARTWNVKYQGSDDNITYSDMTESFDTTAITSSQSFEDTKKSNVTTPVRYVRFVVNTNYYTPAINVLQFYGRQNGGVQTWLHAAGITNKNYTTLSEVLADTSTLSTLINNHSACDYLVTCKGWATTICADSNAMTYIGLNNYCANKLLADATWCNAIWNSTYKTSVLNVSVPIMTDYTTPSGEVIESGHRTDLPDAAGWYAFGNQPSSRGWFSQNSGSTDTYLGYVFDDDVRLVAVVISPHTSPNTNSILRDTGYIQGSNDSFVTSDTLDTIAVGSYTDLTVVTPNNKKFRSIRLFASRGSGTNNTVIRQLQFYGRKDV